MRFILATLLAGMLLVATHAPRTHADYAVTWNDVDGWIDLYAPEYGVSAAYLRQVAWCEAKGDPYAVGLLGEQGPFQFHPRGVWWSTPAGRAGISVYAASIPLQVEMAAWAFASGYGYHWSCA